MPEKNHIPQLVDHLFRHESGKLVSVLTRIFGIEDLDEAIEIAKGNPEFAYVKGARIEVRPIKTREEGAGKDYPTGK